MGGGRRHYLPKAAGGRRTDDVNLIEWAKEQGYTYAEDKSDFEDATTDGKLSLPFLGLFASSHMSYELDRDVEKQASLLEMTKTAVESLQHASKDSEHGYFIMIEASRIDHAGHANDAAGHIHDTLMYNEVMAYLKEHVSANPDTQLLSAADHECGGLTLPDGWDPRPLAEPQSTTEHLTELFASYKGPDAKGYLKSDILPQYGLGDLSDDKVAALLVTYKNQGSGAFQTALGHASADKAGINWSTGKHSSVDVVLYGHAVGKAVAGMKKLIGGNRDNTELPLYLEKVLGVSLANATAKLQENGKDWIQKREDLSIIKHEALVAAKMHAHGDM
jgi:alkaline phosphatase